MDQGDMQVTEGTKTIGWRIPPYNEPADFCLHCGKKQQLQPLGESPRKDICPKCRNGHCFVAAKGRRARRLGRSGVPTRSIQNPRFPEEPQRKIHFVLQLVGKVYPETED